MIAEQAATAAHVDTDEVLNSPDDLNHYFTKRDMTTSIVTGMPVNALCGVRFVITSHGGGKTWDGKADTCTLCGIIVAGLQP